MNDKALIKRILFLAIAMSFSACLQVFHQFFIYWRFSFFNEPWRWWTAHWVHVGWTHYFLNMLAFACLPFIFPQVKNRHLIGLLLILPLFISFCFYYFYPNVEAYAGLSGVLHGLYVACAMYYLQFKKERKFSTIVLCLVLAKIIWENTFGSLQTAELIGSPILVEAHFLGAIGGLCVAVIYFSIRYVQRASSK
ncbi:rhombosortase [Acinetobacter silvestris]|uniref:Rhombosortase n=1 Tax=Acinetobacter silvestris TaxID=1977882 RepID=A0A1Y3CJT9_9GAMM|nr:rhombosortase [Acinetobacter silvestris]OTG67441.1 rhombosortase [Acinetobacter silvestris]